eukprot:4593708-Pleurochrysis_carterae.AAC.1
MTGCQYDPPPHTHTQGDICPHCAYTHCRSVTNKARVTRLAAASAVRTRARRMHGASARTLARTR